MFRVEKEKHNGMVITSLVFGSSPLFRSMLKRPSEIPFYKTKEVSKNRKQLKGEVDNEGLIRQIFFPKITMWCDF